MPKTQRLLLVLSIFPTLGCAQMLMTPREMAEAEMIKPNPAPPSAVCPAPGSSIPIGQLWAEAPGFVGCDVTSEVAFQALMQACPLRVVMNPGDQCIQIAPPKQQGQLVLKVDGNAAKHFFREPSGTVFQVRGTMLVDLDMGVQAFVASGARPVPPSTSEPASSEPASAPPVVATAPEPTGSNTVTVSPAP